MNRSAFAPALTLLFTCAVAASAAAQAKPAAPTTAAAPARAGFVTPLKGEATIQVIPGTSKFDPKAKEIVTTYKLKNTSSAPIALLKIDEYWYEKGGKMVSTDTQRYRQPFQPGEVIEVTTHAPATGSPAGWNKNVTFTHANGKVTPKKVDKF
jgi:hypothetical protein